MNSSESEDASRRKLIVLPSPFDLPEIGCTKKVIFVYSLAMFVGDSI
jgi:hypothetical protein